MARKPLWGDRFFPKQLLAVRVPHNSSRRVLQIRTPNPWPPPGCPVARLPGVGFTVKPVMFQLFSASLLAKLFVFQQVRLPDPYNHLFVNDFGCPIYNTNAFFNDFGCSIYKTNCLLKCFGTESIKQIIFCYFFGPILYNQLFFFSPIFFWTESIKQILF